MIVKKPGSLKLQIKDQIGKENSQLVDENSVILRPELGDFKLEI